MKKTFAAVALACFLVAAFLPVFTLTKGPGTAVGRMPLLIIYPGLVDMIRMGDFRYVPLVLLWIGMHLFLALAPAGLVVRALSRRKQKRAAPGGPKSGAPGARSPAP